MTVRSARIPVASRGDGDTLDLTGDLARELAACGLADGVAVLFIGGSTAGLTTIEFEPGAVGDLGRLFEEIAPRDRDYRHHQAWGDDNGHSHVRAALLGPSLSVPFTKGRLGLGTWQQVILVDFDTRPRRREVQVQFLGE
ncbi:MAG: YjbQ family protein [Candidatus Krumholzibacteriota bacterium]|nr:YjbQ family protein [Candidatus Krumholzibacteriota bacterium]